MSIERIIITILGALVVCLNIYSFLNYIEVAKNFLASLHLTIAIVCSMALFTHFICWDKE